MKHTFTTEAYISLSPSIVKYLVTFSVNSLSPKAKYNIDKVFDIDNQNIIHNSKLTENELSKIEQAIRFTVWEAKEGKNASFDDLLNKYKYSIL